MKKNLLCLLLAAAMLLSVMAGCANNEAPEASEPVQDSAPVEDSAPVDEAPAEEPAPAEGEEESQVPAIEPVTYPLTGDDMTLSYWYYIPPYTHVTESNSSFHCIPFAEEATGVTLEFVEVGSAVASEQFNLMIASETWTDIIPANEYYNGGLAQAYEDEVILDLTEYVYQYMPDFVNIYEQQDEQVKKGALTDGMMLSFVSIADGSYSGNGLVTRGDWMDEMGFEFSGDTIDLDEFTDYMRLVHEEYETPYTYYLEPGAQIMQLYAAFDCMIPNLYAGHMSVVGPQIFRRGDVVTSGWIEDGYRDYMEWMLGLFDEGVLYSAFLEVDTDRMVQNNNIGAGMAAVWQANADKLDECAGYADENNQSFRAQAIPTVVADVNGEHVWKETPNLVSALTSITTTSEKVELACKWMNYFWTEEGSILTNYGVRGETYDVGPDGEIIWLDLVVNNPLIGNPEMGVAVYTFSRFSTSYMDNDRLLSTFTDNALSAVELWTIDGVDDRYYPSLIKLTTEENDEVNQTQNDVLTYGQETALRFLTRDMELNDENWNTYIDTLMSMGLEGIIEVYQTAYDQFIAGER